jgi:hypothetical protein
VDRHWNWLATSGFAHSCPLYAAPSRLQRGSMLHTQSSRASKLHN